MIPFGELKNNLKRLQDSNKHMNIISKIGWSKNALDQKQIKNQPVEFYLRVIHYVLIEYSTQLYKAILDLIPNIKALSDQKFVESCFTICRKILNINPKITPEQFLQPAKLVEKKVQFVVQLCENIHKWDSNNRKKSSKQTKQTNQLRNYIQEPISYKNNVPPPSFQDQDEDQLMEREITVKPTEFFQPFQHSFAKHGELKKETQISRQTVSINNKPNVFPKNLKNQFLDDEDDQQLVQTAKFSQPKKTEPQGNKLMKQTSPVVVQKEANEGSTQYITKQQFNQVLEMIANINGTVNGLVSKFSNFQMNVTTWFNNTNARILLLQQNVKMIKSNL